MYFEERKTFFKKIIVASIATAMGLIFLVISMFQEFSWELVGGGIFSLYLLFSFIYLVIDDDTIVNGVFVGSMGRTISMPGIIFSLELSSVLFMLLYRFIIAPLITFFIALVVFSLGLLLSLIIAPFAFPIYLIKDIYNVKEETKLTEKVVEGEGSIQSKIEDE